MEREQIENKLKEIVVTSLDLEDITVADIDTDIPLFGDGLGLDSIDALELGMAVKKAFGIAFCLCKLGKTGSECGVVNVKRK